MIWTLNVKLVRGLYAKGPWAGSIALDSTSTLEDLHYAIQRAVDFDADHLYEFFLARTERSLDRTRFDDEDDALFTRTIESLFPLPKDRRLYYLFDYGDSWVFQIARARNQPFEADPGVEYPRLVSEKGARPDQYPESDF